MVPSIVLRIWHLNKNICRYILGIHYFEGNDMTPEQMQRFRNAIKDNKVDFYFIPSGKMKIKLLEKQDDILNKLPASMITSILSCGPGDGFLIESSLVTKYLDGSLDSNNAYFLSLGEIRVGGIIDMVL